MRVLISARSSTASLRVPTRSSSGTSSRESASFSSSPTFASRAPESSRSPLRSSIRKGLYTIPATPSAVPTAVAPRGPAEDKGDDRDHEQRSHKRQYGPDQDTVSSPHQQECGHAG